MISQLGRYEIVGELGRGSMGIVYKARDPLIDRFVAIKVIDLEGLTAEEKTEYEARFIQEAQAAGRLNHSNIYTIHDMGESGNVAYIAMEILQGRELQVVMEEKQRLSVDEALHIAIQVADGLGYAHQHGIVHRDIKPANIMVLDDSRVKIADFGIAKMDASLVRTYTGKILGSPLYMSPEQILAQPLDARSDIFSFGIVMYQMFTGKLPFTGDNVQSVMYQIVNSDPPLPSASNSRIPDMLDEIVFKCLNKEPGARYQNAAELADDLRFCREMLQGSGTSLHHFMAGKYFNSLRRFAVPGGIPQSTAAIGGYIAMAAIFIADILNDATIQMHLLYIFPLIIIGFHCGRRALVTAATVMAISLQAVTLLSYGTSLPLLSKFILALLILPSNVLIVYVARVARANFMEVEHLASFDWLTGLLNRQRFESIVEMEIKRQKRYGGYFSFAYVDLDNFKQLNDLRGHKAGDEALKLFAKVVREHVRQSDTVGRLGGDEFAILMPNTNADDCKKLCKQLSVTLSNRMNVASFPISASIGHVTFDQVPVSIIEVFEKADSAMYAAKENGKALPVGA